jgi:hypothetical protein
MTNMQETIVEVPLLSYKLRHLTAELSVLDENLKSNQPLDNATLREFRRVLDNVRLTAWTINELLDARQSQKDPNAVMSFLSLQRLRRLSQMVQDLCSDLDRDGVSWSGEGLRRFTESLSHLCEQLRKRWRP